MENASKALLMAGGMLIALLIVGALILMFNQIGEYEKAQSGGEKNSQLVAFNKEFTQYTYDDIKGYELITLINKAIDFNTKEPIGNSVNYEKKITINVTNIKNGAGSFIGKYGVSGKATLFRSNQYSVNYKTDPLPQIIQEFSSLETTYTLGVMSKLSANYDSIKNGDKTIAEVTGRDIPGMTIDKIEKYREYSEFKNSTFRVESEPKYEDGQIVELSFEFVK